MKKRKFLITIFVAVMSLSSILLLSTKARAQDSCTADMNNDGIVDLTDYSIFVSSLFKDASVNPKADFDKNLFIDLTDYSIFSSNFLDGVINCKPQNIVNMLKNPDFESGTTYWNMGSASLTTEDKNSGNNSIKYTTGGNPFYQGWLSATPGKKYMLTGWFKWTEYSGTEWGYSYLSVNEVDGKTYNIQNLQDKYEKNKWHKIAILITATTNQIEVRGGMFGPKAVAKLYFDNFQLFEKTSNQPPIASPTASVSSGPAPLTVNFAANASDVDGAVSLYQWDFGDGGQERNDSPKHTFITPGEYNVKLSVTDTEGVIVTKTIPINVTGSGIQTIITGPTTNENHTTNSETIVLSGTSSSTSKVTQVNWDDVSNGEGGTINISPATNINWTTSSIKLKPGNNEILVTSFDENSRISTDKIFVNRQISAPVVSNVRVNSTSIPIYEKYEINFDLKTVADDYLFRYDENPPAGVKAKTGVTAEAVITTPSGKILTQPAFYQTVAQKSGAKYVNTASNLWAVRYAPTELGSHSVKINIKDASGTTSYTVGNFTSTSSSNKGFIQVSKSDPRYFEYQDGSLFWPVGPVLNESTNVSGTTNFKRFWFGGLGIYSTNWARWKNSSELHGNEGFMTALTYYDRYPSSELSHYMSYPNGTKIWISDYLDDCCGPVFKNSTNYQLKIRLKVTSISGPKTAGKPWGLSVKRHGWVGNDAAPDLSAKTPLIPYIQAPRDWHSIVTRFNTGSTGTTDTHLSIYLENITGGEAFIDELSIREVLADGSLGPEIIRNPKADMHKYVEQRPAQLVDDMIATGKANGIFYKFVVQDKNDWIPNHLDSLTGAFVNAGGGYYQVNGTKSRWLQEQWWRYVSARWGYSTNVHSWELNNEGPPDDGTGFHAIATQDFAKFFKQNNADPQMATTSLWCCWRPTFWGNKTKFPDIAYADIHEYTNGDVIERDAVAWSLKWSNESAKDKVGMPVMRGETGFNGNEIYNILKQSNSGLWYHHLNWAQLHSGSMMDPLYWHTEHLSVINQSKIAGNFNKFISTLDINKGGYVDIASNVSNTNLLVLGQKNITSGKAYMWIQNKNDTWYNNYSNASIPAQTGTVKVKMSTNSSYRLEWWDTYNGTVTKNENVTSDGNGDITININNLQKDLAIKIFKN